jgi:hypothetical protein
VTTTVIKSIKPAGGGDYSSLNTWESANRADLVSLDQIRVAEVYSGGNALLANTYIVLNAGWTTNPTHYIEIRGATGEQHQGIFSTSKAYMEYLDPAHSEIIEIYKDARITRMQCRSDLYSIYAAPAAGHEVYVDQCLCIIAATANLIRGTVYNAGAGLVTVRSSVVLNNGSGGGWGIACLSTGPVNSYGNTIVAPNYAYHAMAAGSDSQDNYLSAGTCYHGTIVKGDHDATSNNEATTPALRSIAYSTANFVSVTLGSEDFHLNPTSVLRWGGVDQAGLTTDFEGQARHSPPSIGADDDPSVILTVDSVDGVTASEAISRVGNIPVSILEGLTVSESVVRLVTALCGSADGISIYDSPQRTLTVIVTASDVTTFQDLASSIRTAFLGVYDGVEAVDRSPEPIDGMMSSLLQGQKPFVAIQVAYPRIEIRVR